MIEANEDLEDPEYQRKLMLLVPSGSSLEGARPKVTFRAADGSLWLAKFPSRHDRNDVGAWEMLVHGMAADAGIVVPPAQLIKRGAHYRTFAVQRFDRVDGRRRFFTSAMALLDKRDGDGGTYPDLAKLIQNQARSQEQLLQLWTRMVFNILVANRDDHLRNHGFILTRSGWSLAPAFDMNPNPTKRDHALAIDTEATSPNVELALRMAGEYGLKSYTAEQVLKRIRAVVATWRDRARRLHIPRTEVDIMTAAFEQ